MNNSNIDLARAGKNIPFLDGIRGFAVSFVLLYHFLPKTISLATGSTFNKIWDVFWLMGWSGVDLFFVLSGFLITGILYKSKSKKNYFKNFYIRRFLRIFPLYYLVIIMSAIFIRDYHVDIWYWLYLSNFDVSLNIPFHPVLVVAWSLSIEEQYYLLYPSIVYFLNDKSWIRLLFGLIILSFSLRIAGHHFGWFIPRQMYHHTILHFDGIALGGLLRMLIFNYEKYQKVIKAYMILWPLMLILTAYVAYSCGTDVLNEYSKTYKLGLVSFQPMMYQYGYLLNSLSYGGLILYCLHYKNWFTSIFSHPAARSVGKYSYAMYLLQYPAHMVFGFILSFLPSADYPFKAIALGLFTYVIAYLIARLSWIIFEGPLNQLKDKLAPSHH
ncbi:MAG: acyltransferase [Bacteroidia bacterium]